MKIEGFPEKKNLLIKRLAAVTHKFPVYNGAPDFSYDVGPYRILRDGSVTVLEDEADPAAIDALIREQLLIDPNPASQSVEQMTPSPDPEEEQNTNGSMESGTEPADPIASSETLAEEQTKPTFSIVHEVRAKVYDEPIAIQDRVVTIQTMINLINMIYSKGEILNHALLQRKAFWVDERVVIDIPYEKPTTFQALLRLLKTRDRAGLVRGIEFTPNSVIFTGFPATNDYATRIAYERLAEAMYRYSTEMQWVNSKRLEPENEKYFFRNWINHIGLKGQENRTFREILLKNLDGNGTFRTKDQLVAYKAKRDKEKENRRKAAIEHENLALSGAAF